MNPHEEQQAYTEHLETDLGSAASADRYSSHPRMEVPNDSRVSDN